MEKINRAVLSARELSVYLGIGLSKSYQLFHADGFPTVRLGKRLFVPREQLEIWLKKQISKTTQNDV